MSKIRFEDGTVVNFDGTPTPQDVEEVAKKLQLRKKSQTAATANTTKKEKPKAAPGSLDSFVQDPTIRGASKVGDFLGLGPLGRGFGASVLGQFLPEVRKAQEAQAAEAQATAGLPAETLRRMAQEGKSVQESGSIRSLEQGTTQDLSNKQVLSSALSTALLAAGGSAKAPLQGSQSALTRLGGRAALGAGQGATQAGAVAGAEGKSNEDIAKSTIAGGIIGGLIPVAIEGGKLALKASSKLSGIATGSGAKQTEMMAQRGFEGKAGTLKQFKGQSPKEVADASREAVDVVRDAQNRLYQRDMAALETGRELDITGVKEALTKKIQENLRGNLTSASPSYVAVGDEALEGVAALPQASKKGLDLSKSKAGETSQNIIENVYNKVNNWDDFSVGGVDALKQQLGDMAFEAPRGSKGFQFAVDAQKKLTKVLNQVDGYEEITSKYADTKKAINFAEEVLNLRRKKNTGEINVSTAMNKLANVLKDNRAREVQLEALQEISRRSGRDLVGMVLAQTARQPLAEGFVGKGALAGTALLTGSPGGVALLPAIAQTALATSPAVASQVALRGGQVAGAAARTGVPQAVRRILPQLLGAVAGQ